MSDNELASKIAALGDPETSRVEDDFDLAAAQDLLIDAGYLPRTGTQHAPDLRMGVLVWLHMIEARSFIRAAAKELENPMAPGTKERASWLQGQAAEAARRADELRVQHSHQRFGIGMSHILDGR